MKILKFILNIIFPFLLFKTLFLNIKDDMKDGVCALKKFDFWDSNIGWTLKLYSLTSVIPFAGTVMIILFSILGQTMKYSFFEGIWRMWCDFYITGTFLDVAAWRWQIILLIVAFIFNIANKDS